MKSKVSKNQICEFVGRKTVLEARFSNLDTDGNGTCSANEVDRKVNSLNLAERIYTVSTNKVASLYFGHIYLKSSSNCPQNQNLCVLSFSKLSLLLIFGQVKAEMIKVKDTRGHFQVFKFLSL